MDHADVRRRHLACRLNSSPLRAMVGRTICRLRSVQPTGAAAAVQRGRQGGRLSVILCVKLNTPPDCIPPYYGDILLF